MVSDRLLTDDDFDALAALWEIVGLKPKTRTLKSIGIRLASLIGRDHAFTPGYLFNVLAVPPHQEVGAPLALAIHTYWLASQEVRPPHAGALTSTQEIRVYDGAVEPMASFSGRSRRCNNPRCIQPFIRTNPAQTYCSFECKREARSLRGRKQ